jgi:protein-ribulosamine 3-kinase
MASGHAGREDEALASVLQSALGGRWTLRPLHASAFAATWLARRGGERLFVKAGGTAQSPMLEAEADGLAAIAATRTVRVPAVAACSAAAGDRPALLALEWLALAPPAAGFGARLGQALAGLHRAPVDPPRYGWPRDNFIGATPQRNRPTAGGTRSDWLRFVADERLGAMRARLAAAGEGPALLQAVDAVITALPRLVPEQGRAPRPSLIHGDLWSGNWGMLADGTPVVWDPAVSWSDAEADLAMMELFGTPPAGFWPAYLAAAGLDTGYPRRRPLHQLYHLLNHVLLFGGGYRRQAMGCAHEVLVGAPPDAPAGG